MSRIHKYSKFRATKTVKMVVLTFWNQRKLISRKINVAGKLLNFHTVSQKLLFFHFLLKRRKFRQMKSYQNHSVEKYTKTLSRAKIFRQTTHQKCAKSTFTNAWFFTLRGLFWVKWTKQIWKIGTYAWIYNKEHL